MPAAALPQHDWQLVHQATAAIGARFVAGWHEVGAALRTDSGRVLTAGMWASKTAEATTVNANEIRTQ